jgi:hypothetical protein
MALNMTQRYATVEAFWQTFQEEPGHKRISEALDSIVGSPSTPDVSTRRGKTSTTPEVSARGGAPPSRPQHVQAGRRSRKRFLLPIFLLLLVMAVIGAGFLGMTNMNTLRTMLTSIQNHTLPGSTTPTLPLPTLAPISSATVAATVTASNSTHLFQSYKGTLQELSTNVPSQMTLTHLLQNGGIISGSFTSTLMRGSFNGYLDSSKHIFFTVTNPSGAAPLYFQGTVQSAGNLVGSFCAIDQNNACISGDAFGVWNVVPGP